MLPTPPVETSQGWAYAWQGFLLDMETRKRSPSTISNRKCSVTIMAKHATADGLTEPDLVTREWLKQYLTHQGKDRKGNGYPSLYQDLRAFWCWWVDDATEEHDGGQQAPPNPMSKIPRPAMVNTTVPVLSEHEIDRLLAACGGRDFESMRNRAIVLLLLATGLRRFELTALDVADVDIPQRTVAVRRGKGGKARITVFGPVTAQALLRYLRVRAGRAHAIQPALFVSRTGARLTPGGASQVITRIGRQAGIEWLRPHVFRHTWADRNLTDGIQEHDLCKLAGWTTTKMIGRYGAVRAEERAIEAGLRFTRRLSGHSREPSGEVGVGVLPPFLHLHQRAGHWPQRFPGLARPS